MAIWIFLYMPGNPKTFVSCLFFDHLFCTKTRKPKSCQTTTEERVFVQLDQNHVTKQQKKTKNSYTIWFPQFFIKKNSSPILICFYFLFHIPANTKNFCEGCLYRLQLSPDRFKCMLLFHGSLSIFWSDTADMFSEIWNR